MLQILPRASLLGALCWLCGVLTAGPAGATTWQWPLPGHPAVVRGFLPPATPYGAGHRGVDLAGRPGMAVLAAGAGVVGYAGALAGRGVVTVLHDGGLRTTYEPVVSSVRPGQRVGAGALLGRLAAGHAGCPVTACLHWGLLRGETYLDPLALLGAGRVRLLPLAGQVAARPAAMSRAGHPGFRPAAAATGFRGRTPVLADSSRTGHRPAPLTLIVPLAASCAASAARTSSRAAAGRPWCASGRPGSP